MARPRTAPPVALVAIALAAPLVFGRPALAQDVDRGAFLAKIWCASCHVVSDEQEQASADVPTFRSISQNFDFQTETLRAFLTNPHPAMPNLDLSREEIADLLAYIDSLRRPDLQN